MEQNSPQPEPISPEPISMYAGAAVPPEDAIVGDGNRDSKVAIKQQAPNTEAKISAVTNGVFNGISIASIPMSAVALGAEWGGANLKKGKIIWTALGTVALGAAGGVWGWLEAKKLKTYRDTIADEVGRLEDRLECLERLHAKPMAEREKERQQSTAGASVAIS